MALRIKQVTLYVISMPLKSPFITHLQTVTDREGIIIEVMDIEGNKGYGEAVAFTSPWYTEETVKTCYHMLTDFLIPMVLKTTIDHPSELAELFRPIRRNQMAKASIEMAIWDLYAKQSGSSLSKIIGGELKKIPAGAVVGTQNLEDALSQIEKYVDSGYQRIKIKIDPENDYQFVEKIRKEFPTLPLMADANSAYSLKDLDKLKRLDEFNLLMIEQPLAFDDYVDHAKLQKNIKTPICLDESITSFSDARRAIELNSCGVINIKIGRVGGLYNAKRIYDLCMKHNIQVWVGGMLEFGISRAHNIALASLPGFLIPGDISASSRYWDEDITSPEVLVKDGFIDVPKGSGSGYKINEKRLAEVTLKRSVYK